MQCGIAPEAGIAISLFTIIASGGQSLGWWSRGWPLFPAATGSALVVSRTGSDPVFRRCKLRVLDR
jgi:hypothetical protein